MVLCTFKSNYWDFDQEKKIEFPCDNETQSNSDLCIFHDSHFLDNIENRETIEKEFQKKIDLSIRDKKPLFCIEYYLHDVNITDREFFSPVYFNNTHFLGSVTIISQFLNHIVFSGSKFSGKGNVSFSGSKFSGKGNVSFSGSKFSGKGNVSFSGSKFSGKGNVSFSGTEFLNEGYVSFFKSIFSNEGKVSFSGSQFSRKGSVNFSTSEFLNDRNVSFFKSIFSNEGDVSFSGSQFSGKGSVSFSGSEFSGKGSVSFSGSEFSGKGNVSFSGSEFLNEGYVSFFKSIFSKENRINFSRSQFSGKGSVNFSGSKFSGKGSVNFSRSQFSGKGSVNFSSSQFLNEGDVDFSEFKFLNEGDVSFLESQFSGKGNVDFSGSEFSNEGDVDFTRSKFLNEGDVFFIGSQFSGIAYFNNCSFKTVVTKTGIFFKYVIFKSPEEVKFDVEDLSKVSFSNTDITRIVFGENTCFGKLKSEEEERFKIFDERRFEDYFNKRDNNKDDDGESSDKIAEIPTLGIILASYRNLRENYEYRLRYDDAGQFFIREMELKRKYRNHFTEEKKYIPKKNGWFRRNLSFIGIYHFICKYGESSIIPLILFGIIILLSTFYWVGFSSIDANYLAIIQTSCKEDNIYLCSLMRSLSDIVGFPDEGKIIDYITRITSIIVLATLLLPFRRKFERKFRH